jgi:hypothetical protein
VHGAPHDIKNRELFLNKKSRWQAAKEMGIHFKVAPRLSNQSGVEQVRQVLNICWFDEAGCTQKFGINIVGIGSLENFRKEWNERLQSYRNDYLHDWASHGAKAFQTLAFLHRFAPPVMTEGSAAVISAGTGRRNIDRENPRGWT